MEAGCRKSLIWVSSFLLVAALAGWGGVRQAQAAAPEAPDLSWSEEAACAVGVDYAALEAPDWAADVADTAEAPAKPAPGGKSCTVNGQCKGKQYCAKAVGDCKGKGECTARPDLCPLIFKPVCGCNGKTYSNSCFAAMAGVNVKAEGACTKPKGGTYTCKTNKECGKGDFCAKDMGKCDEEGVCAQRPRCNAIAEAPVCGCNNKTYSNACLAHSAGVSVKHEGKCEK